MKYLIILAILASLSVFAVEPLEKAEIKLTGQLNQLEAKYELAKANIVKEHIKTLEALLVAYTKKGDFDKAMEIKEALKLIDVSPLSKYQGDYSLHFANKATYTLKVGELYVYLNGEKTNFRIEEGIMTIDHGSRKRDTLDFKSNTGKHFYGNKFMAIKITKIK